MEFEFTEDEQMWQKSMRENVERYLAPGFKERWHYEGGLNRDILPMLRDMDLLGFAWPEEYGGKGFILPPMMMAISNYELGRGDMSACTIWGATIECGEILTTLGKKELLDEWGPVLASGDKFCGYTFVEPGKGSDLGNIDTVGTYDEATDTWTINGDKASVSFCTADCFIAAVRTGDPETKPGPYGISLFLIPADTPGVTPSVYEDFGLKEIGRGDVAYRDVKLSSKYLLGEREGGFRDIMHIFDAGRPGIALECIGAADKVMEECVDYCMQRKVFGKPLSFYEGISFGMAEAKCKLDAAKLIAYKAFKLRQDGKWNAMEAGQAKFYGCEEAFNAIWFCTRAYGHLGYTSEYDALFRLADVMGFAWGDGSWEVCKMVAARDAFGEEWLPYQRQKKHPHAPYVAW